MFDRVLRFVDKFGCLDQLLNPRSGGDSCQRDFMYICLYFILRSFGIYKFPEMDFHKFFLLHYRESGLLIRHPAYNDASDWDRGSRDNSTPYLIACSFYKYKFYLWHYFFGHIKRGMFYTNTRKNGANKHNHDRATTDYRWRIPDWGGPEIWAIYLRGFRLWFLYPLILIFDLHTLGSAIQKRYFPKNNIVFNHELVKLHAMGIYPTPFILLAIKIYTPEMAMKAMTEHFNDFGGEEFDMMFFVDMFQEAYKGKI